MGCQTPMGSHRVGHDRSDLAAAAAGDGYMETFCTIFTSSGIYSYFRIKGFKIYLTVILNASKTRKCLSEKLFTIAIKYIYIFLNDNYKK